MTVDDLRLAWGDGKLELRGERTDHWDMRGALLAPSLALIDSVARGRLTADFQIEGPVDTPRVRLTAHGDSLGFRGDSAKALDLSLVALFSPAFHLNQLALSMAGVGSILTVAMHVAALAGVTVLFVGLTARRLSRLG